MSKKNYIAILKRNFLLQALLLCLSILPLRGEVVIEDDIQVVKLFADEMENRIPELMKRYDIPGLIIGVIHEGRLVWKEAFGYADLATGTPMTTENVCRMESLSKPVTAAGVMKLVSEGLIDLDSPVRDYLHSWEFPLSAYPVEDITLRMLLSNTSGLPLGTIGMMYEPSEERPGLRETLNHEVSMNRMPGSSFEYSNTGFNLLELLIEEVTHRDFSMYMEEEIFQPLGMINSDYRCKPKHARQVPTGYDVTGKPVPLYVYSEKGAGGLFSTLDDYAKFLIAGMQFDSVLEKDVSFPKGRKEMYRKQTEVGGLYGMAFPGYGFGHFIEPLSNGYTAVSHGGQGSGWMTHFHSIPETGDGIIILCNSQRSWPLFANILGFWGEWNGADGIGMTHILKATKVLWGFVGMIAITGLWLVGRVIFGITQGTRTFTLFSGRRNSVRIIVGISGVFLVGGWLVAALQDYLFLTAVFPVAAIWFGYAILLLAAAFFAIFLFPARK